MKYTVKSNLKHDGRDYVEGDTIELEEADATPLVEGGTIVAEEGGEETPSTDGDSTEGDSTEGGDNSEGDQSEGDAEKSEYKVLQSVEFPQGTPHEVDAILELTDEEAAGFAEGMIEKVEGTDDAENL